MIGLGHQSDDAAQISMGVELVLVVVEAVETTKCVVWTTLFVNVTNMGPFAFEIGAQRIKAAFSSVGQGSLKGLLELRD